MGLDGTLRHTTGILPMVALARERGIPTVSVPAVNALEAALIRNVAVIPVQTLAELVAHLRREVAIAHTPSADLRHRLRRGARSGARQAGAGGGRGRGHNVLLAGPPGAGKTLLARALASILPAMDPREAL